MPAANESQGLKIAVAAFVTLTVVLAVTTYFAYSSYSQASAKLVEADSNARKNQQLASEALRNLDTLKERTGYKADDFTAVQDAIKKDEQKLLDQLKVVQGQVQQMIEQYRAAGGSQEKVNELAQAAGQLVAQIEGEPNRTFQSTLDRMMALVSNMAQLTTTLSLDNEDLRTNLSSVDRVNAEQLQVQLDKVKKAKDDLAAEHDRHEMERSGLLQKYDDLQTRSSQQATEIARLTQQLAQQTDEAKKRSVELTTQLRSLREAVEKSEDVMDTPDGRITFVDYNRGEVRTDLTRAMGARERLQFSVFAGNATGLATDRPKGLIELIQVTDRGSIGRIIRTNTPSDPIRYNDYVYSAGWSRDRPERFALIGKIDIDRDGRDDRQDLIRMIRAAGGEIDYDLPEPGSGPETGKITGLTSWYVVDDREPYRPNTGRAADLAATDQGFNDKRTAALRAAHENGVRPIAIERLLAQLGYVYGSTTPGRVEAIDRRTSNQLINPRGRTGPIPASGEPSEPGNEPDAAMPEPAQPQPAPDQPPADGGFFQP